MLLNNVKPFQISSYKKSAISEEKQVDLLTSYSCIQPSMVVMAGAVIDSKMLLCKKTKSGHLFIKGNIAQNEKREMSVKKIITEFKQSFGLDFLVLNLKPYFLITRKGENDINMYMTTSNRYIEVFSDPNRLFKDIPVEITNYGSLFTIKKINSARIFNTKLLKIKKDGVYSDEDSKYDEGTKKKDIVQQENTADTYKVEMDEQLDEEAFKRIFENDSTLTTVKYGKIEDGKLKLIQRPLKKMDKETLVSFFEYFSTSSDVNYVELNGKTNFAGFTNENNEFEWFAELPKEVNDNGYEYVLEVASIMHYFTSSDKSSIKTK